MICIELTGKECLQFQYILPVQGSLSTLEMVEGILEKVSIKDKSNIDDFRTIEFSRIEVDFIESMINILNVQQNLRFESLSLIKKFLKLKETENV